MKPMSMRRGLPLIMYGPSISLSMRSPVNGSPVWRQASSTRLVGCRWVSMIIASAPGQLGGDGTLELRLCFGNGTRWRGRFEADHARGVVAQVIFEGVLIEVQTLRRLMAEHFEQTQPHARF